MTQSNDQTRLQEQSQTNPQNFYSLDLVTPDADLTHLEASEFVELVKIDSNDSMGEYRAAVLAMRQALKLTSKIAMSYSLGEEIIKMSLATGLFLALTSSKKDLVKTKTTVSAGFLYMISSIVEKHGTFDQINSFTKVVKRKFGEETIKLLHFLNYNQISEIDESEHPVVLRRSKKIQDACIFVSGQANELDIPLNCNHNWNDLRQIRNAVNYIFDLYSESYRKWGRDELLPMYAHAVDVALILTLLGSDKEIVISGLLHDALEEESKHDAIKKYCNRSTKQIAVEIGELFGEKVAIIVQGVTEDRTKSDIVDWNERKNKVMEAILAAAIIDPLCSQQMAIVYCASKISTISAGNKFLYQAFSENRSFDEILSQWSAGTYEMNQTHFKKNLAFLSFLGISPFLLGQYKDELFRFLNPGGKKHIFNVNKEQLNAEVFSLIKKYNKKLKPLLTQTKEIKNIKNYQVAHKKSSLQDTKIKKTINKKNSTASDMQSFFSKKNKCEACLKKAIAVQEANAKSSKKKSVIKSCCGKGGCELVKHMRLGNS